MSDPGPLARATIFVALISAGDEDDYRWVREWLARWGERVRIVHDSSSAPDFVCDVEGPAEAIAEIPERMRCVSEWSRRPYPPVRERKERRHGRR